MNRQCNCGSGLAKRGLVDARGIFCTFVCDKCEQAKRSKFRPEIFNTAYDHDEPLEDE